MLPKKYQKFIDIMIGYCDGFDEETGGHNYRLHHQLRVAESVYRICRSGELKNVDEKIAVIAGLFHDVGRIHILKNNNTKTLKFERKELDKHRGHLEVSKTVALDLLKNEFSQAELTKLCDAMTEGDNPSKTPESKILHDADFIDELGVLNLFRMFSYSGIINRSMGETVRYWFNIDRAVKLSKMEKCFTKFARKEAKRRIQLQDKIMHELENNGFSS